MSFAFLRPAFFVLKEGWLIKMAAVSCCYHQTIYGSCEKRGRKIRNFHTSTARAFLSRHTIEIRPIYQLNILGSYWLDFIWYLLVLKIDGCTCFYLPSSPFFSLLMVSFVYLKLLYRGKCIFIIENNIFVCDVRNMSFFQSIRFNLNEF